METYVRSLSKAQLQQKLIEALIALDMRRDNDRIC